MGAITRRLSRLADAMLFTLIIILVVVGGGVSGTAPKKPPSKCLSPAARDKVKPLKCGPNSYFERCSKVCPPQNCSTLLDPNWLCESNCCVPECRCYDGYLRDDRTGLCISRAECLAQCDSSERFVQDSMECQKTCANYKITGPRRLCPPFTGCVCDEGRVRLNDNGTGECVLPQQCPHRKCPLYEHLENCPSVCANETCISKNPDYKCLLPAIPLPCKPRCICDKGYLRNHLGQCIPEDHCPHKRCPINEVWRCASICPQDSCKRLEPGFKCPHGVISVCIPACACKDGFLRDEKGHCIPRDLCPASLSCGINEVAVECKSYLPQTCESVYTLYRPIDNPPCIPGCDCRPGYLRNKRNICVPSEFCPTVPQSKCGPNQEYKTCGSSCEPSCADLDNPPQVCSDVCVEGCFCKDGYRKDEQGNCVTRDKCPLPVCNKPNEVAKDCGSYCEMRSCEDYNRTDLACPAVCVRGCFCRKGYVRNAYDVCIPTEKCPPQPVCLQENEEYQPCGSSCPDTCDNYEDTERICTMNCVAGCNCKAGYVRNRKDHTCIKPEQCPFKECSGVNEVLKYCASYCPVTCANRYTQGDWACITLCREACDCFHGTLRNDNGTCVPVDQCTPPICRQNEKYMKCGTACPLTCDNYMNPPPCTRQCVEDCFCEDGYVRDRYMRCVKPENCEPICPAGEKFNECSAHCQDTCENYNQTNRICTYQCQSGCVCEAGTVRRKDGQCVAPRECSTETTCPADEVYDPCSAHCEPTCENNKPNRPCTDICTPGCRCADGLVRRKDGKCVKKEECSDKCAPSEHYDDCNAHCEDTCELHGTNVTCLPYCNAGCRCNDGLVRRKDGQCVTLPDCFTPACSVNEEYDPCSAHCEPTCELSGPGRVCAAYCKPGCKCVDGLVRRKDGQCVKLEDCQIKPQCAVNERWVDCRIALCRPLTCEQLGFPIACPGIIGACHDGGCVCVDGYVKDSNDLCIPQQDCLSCGNDFNATAGCGINCGRLCTNYKNPPKCNIPLPCRFNSCDCKKGYVYDPVIERCVAPVDCPVPCNGDVYAEKVKCPNPCPPTCAKPTPQICSKTCLTKGCQCRTGYILDPNGKCVKPENCPDDLGCNGDPNARVSSCVSLCEPKCGGVPVFCPAVCRLGCACKPGYILSKTGDKCIKSEECVVDTTTEPSNEEVTSAVPDEDTPCEDTSLSRSTRSVYTQVETQGNAEAQASAWDGNQQSTSVASSKLILCPNDEIWIDCKAGYCKPQYCRDMKKNLACPQVADPCSGGCICRDGLLRNEEGTCIPKDQCPINKPCTDPNAIRKQCASHESCRATCAMPNSRVCPKICIIDGCECKQGYVLSAKGGKCVRIEDCPQNAPCNGDSNAVIKANPIPCPSTCSAPNAHPWCKKYAPPVGCECKPGFLLADDGGKCIKPDECPGGNPCGANSTFAWCRADCLTDYCPVDDSRAVIACDPPQPCPNGCVCKLNYKKKSAHTRFEQCILSSTCPPVKCTRPNELWDPCPSECRRERCADVNNQPTTCNTLVLNCQPQCVCRKGYFRNDSDICIPANQCPGNQPCDDPNAERLECAPVPSCRSTCAKPNPSPCILSCALNQCVCKKGFVLSEKGGKCIPVDQCPKDAPCNGDSNAVIKANPIPCPSTCDAPNASPWCKKYAPPVGCECKPGYLLAGDGGKCIKPDDCPGGNPCGKNATFAWCSFNCPTNICPVSDTRAIIACSPPYPCPNGCACKPNYKRRSNSDSSCILASDCPPVNCTRPNELWSHCPSPCLRESCADVNATPSTCYTKNQYCQPKCICKKGYFRNDTDICVPAKQCIKNQLCSDPNAERVQCAPSTQCRPTCAKRNPGPCIEVCVIDDCVCKKGFILAEEGGKCIPEDQCPVIKQCSDPNAERIECALAAECRPTCAAPDPGPCIYQICIKNDCVCKKGYILSEKGGKCIAANQCTIQKSCNGDPNAQIKECPLPCPATCDAPNAIPCRKACVPIGCECKDGYILSESNGKCILPEKCKGGNPCGRNETFVPCKVPCLSDYCPVNNSPNRVVCETPNPCLPGCVCKINHRRRSVNDTRCMYASECPPVKCDKNEIWSGCSSDCLQEDCANVNDKPVVCNTLLLNCQPKCICKKGYYRNSDRKCIPAWQCPQSTTTPAPQTCGANEHFESNSHKCGISCRTLKIEPVIGICEASSGCFCDDGYVIDDDTGVCIRREKCPIQCKANEVFKKCRILCPPQTCASIYSDYDCRNATRCEPGCDCINEYLRNGTENDLCIPSNQCPTTPPIIPDCGINEHYESNRIKCELTCNNYKLESIMGPCQPVSACFCNTGLVRNDNGLCIPKKKCPPPIPNCGINEHYESNRIKCELTCKNYKLEHIMGPCQPVSACFCDTDFVRNDNGLCIPKKKCPQNVVCPKNEVVSQCYNSCHKTCKTRLRSDGRMCQLACIDTGCLCVEGYLRHDNGTCVPISECSPPRCNENESYSSCGTACPPTCQNRGDNCTACTAQCVEDCFCNKGYVRSEDGTCVKPKDCPPRTCSDPKETFQLCPPTCPPTDGCSNIWSKFNCTNAVKCCKPQCRCKSGYFRNNNNACVPSTQC